MLFRSKAKADAEAAAKAAAAKMVSIGKRSAGKTPLTLSLDSTYKSKRATVLLNGGSVGTLTLNSKGVGTLRISATLTTGAVITVKVGATTVVTRTI